MAGHNAAGSMSRKSSCAEEFAHRTSTNRLSEAVAREKMREKMRFENSLDDSVAARLEYRYGGAHEAGFEHIILTLKKPADERIMEAIGYLENYCKLLKGCTSKEVLEVFYQEVGLRLIRILQKPIKWQISLSDGFQVIAGLNALQIPAGTINFLYLKMLGHVYIVEDAKDLAPIVNDVARYGGAYRPEDVYEFIQPTSSAAGTGGRSRRSWLTRCITLASRALHRLLMVSECSCSRKGSTGVRDVMIIVGGISLGTGIIEVGTLRETVSKRQVKDLTMLSFCGWSC
ncbi:hypothetical protein GALMADRAFT_141148 [Galerina marginata CBS 339.88]|uniref:Uncharacterized protein n=1 Tax=Galerina marginata (strain CBS 339.88) TaxID=685588 RepID=A0A067SV52_GALM3|nr:hypothetical protein GALMADRAFT_141148 [Galerina marginata CBS 339.88]